MVRAYQGAFLNFHKVRGWQWTFVLRQQGACGPNRFAAPARDLIFLWGGYAPRTNPLFFFFFFRELALKKKKKKFPSPFYFSPYQSERLLRGEKNKKARPGCRPPPPDLVKIQKQGRLPGAPNCKRCTRFFR